MLKAAMGGRWKTGGPSRGELPFEWLRVEANKYKEPRLDRLGIKEQREKKNSRCEHAGTAVGRTFRSLGPCYY